jgi:hypothetical protein
MQQLRNKVFKRVKPKQMNGRLLSGRMFLELCQAYTASINTGSVPSIEGAWTSLCKNENLRAIKQAISGYERLMEAACFSDGVIEYSELKVANKRVTAEVIAGFRTNAFGDDLSAIVTKIEQEIVTKYKAIKTKILRTYERQLKQMLAPFI